MAANNNKYSQVHDVYRLRIEALYSWNGTAWVLATGAAIATEFAAMQALLGIDATSKMIKMGGVYSNLAYQKARKAHIFNTIRSIVYGGDLMYEAQLQGNVLAMDDNIDYKAASGWGITINKGRKLVTDSM